MAHFRDVSEFSCQPYRDDVLPSSRYIPITAEGAVNPNIPGHSPFLQLREPNQTSKRTSPRTTNLLSRRRAAASTSRCDA